MKVFIKLGGQVNLSSVNGFLPLHLAAFKGDVDLVSLLVEAMSPEEISFPGFGGCTPMHLAILSGHLPVVSVLASHGASIIVITHIDNHSFNTSILKRNYRKYYLRL